MLDAMDNLYIQSYFTLRTHSYQDLNREGRTLTSSILHKPYAMGASSKALLVYYASSAFLFLIFGIFKVLHKVCWMERPIVQLIRLIATIDMRKEDYWDDLFGWKMFKAHQNSLLRHLFKEAQEGRRAPNPSLVSVDGAKYYHMLDFARGSRPLIVNFGSCTCPVFMARLREFGEIVEEYSSVADFLTIYIEEAHPTDEWRLKGNFEILQHRNQQERCNAARTLLQIGCVHSNTSLMVDTIENAANKAYGALPIRLVVIQNEKVQYAGGLGPTLYKTADIRNWLSHYRKRLVNRKRA